MFSLMQKVSRIVCLLKPLWNPLQQKTRCYSGSLQALLQTLPLPEITRLDSGLTVTTEYRDIPHACVGLYYDAGSRNESPIENGISHFFQHMVLKGNETDDKACLHEMMNRTGARFGSFTTREHSGYYAQCLGSEIECVIYILMNGIYCNRLDDEELECQKKVVYNELLEHDNDVNELLWDYLHGAAFQGTPLGQSVTGPSNNLFGYTKDSIKNYVSRMFNPKRGTLAYVGPLSHEIIVQMVDYPMNSIDAFVTDDVYRFTGADFRFRDDNMHLANCAIAFEGPCLCCDESYTMDVACAYIGGWESSQLGNRYNAHVLAQAGHFAGLCEAYQAFNVKYKDSSLWGVQFLGDRLHLDEMVYNIQSQFMKLCCYVNEPEIKKAKRELQTYILTQQESAVNRCHDLGRWVLYDKFCPSLHERMKKIESVRACDVQEVCMKFLFDRDPVVAAVGPCESLPDYNRIRAGQYWLRV